MAEGLTQQQIDELLGNIQSGELDINKINTSNVKKVKEYDFRSPKRISKDQLKFLDNIYDNFARFMNLQLSSVLRVGSKLEIIEIEEQEYKEYNNALSDSVLIGAFDIDCDNAKSDMNRILIELDRPLSFSMLDLLLGGSGSGYNLMREYTDIELRIMEYVFKMMQNHLNNAWINYLSVNHKFSIIETNARVIQFLNPDDSIALITLKMTVNNLEGNVNICVPADLIDDLYPKFDTKSKISKRDDGKNETQREMIFESIKKSDLEVKGILGQADILLNELLQLQKGDIVILSKDKIENSAKISVKDDMWFNADVGVGKKNYAVKIKSKL